MFRRTCSDTLSAPISVSTGLVDSSSINRMVSSPLKLPSPITMSYSAWSLPSSARVSRTLSTRTHTLRVIMTAASIPSSKPSSLLSKPSGELNADSYFSLTWVPFHQQPPPYIASRRHAEPADLPGAEGPKNVQVRSNHFAVLASPLAPSLAFTYARYSGLVVALRIGY